IRSPRGQMHTDVMEGRWASDLWADRAHDVIELTLREPLDDLLTGVTVHGDAARTQSGKSPGAFLGQLVPNGQRGPAAFPRHLFLDESRLFGPGNVFLSLPENIAVDDGSTQPLEQDLTHAYGRPLIFGGHRMDVSAEFISKDLASLRRVDEREEEQDNSQTIQF
ncbi:MAG TPA: hypothetical protein VHK88_10200, partial [Aquihabitans sp.]|nr:hypothetical protein [Aquihabitans sp.]